MPIRFSPISIHRTNSAAPGCTKSPCHRPKGRIYALLIALWLCFILPIAGQVAIADQFDPQLEALFQSLKQTQSDHATPGPLQSEIPSDLPAPSYLQIPSEVKPRPHAFFEEASEIVTQIKAIWAQSDNPAIELLGRRVEHALDRHALMIARELAQSMVEISPSHVHGWHLLGTALHRQAIVGHEAAYPKALKAYERAIALEPRHFLALAAAGELAATLGQDEKAIAYLARVQALHPGLVSRRSEAGPILPQDRRYSP